MVDCIYLFFSKKKLLLRIQILFLDNVYDNTNVHFLLCFLNINKSTSTQLIIEDLPIIKSDFQIPSNLECHLWISSRGCHKHPLTSASIILQRIYFNWQQDSRILGREQMASLDVWVWRFYFHVLLSIHSYYNVCVHLLNIKL